MTSGISVSLISRGRGGTYNQKVMAIIEIQRLAKSYQVYQKREGLLASMAGTG